jgi:hypothetical protein
MIILDYCRLRALNDQLMLLERVFLYYHVVFDHFGLLQVASPERSADAAGASFPIARWSPGPARRQACALHAIQVQQLW